MARYVIDPVTGIKTKVSGTSYIPPCVAKNEQRKAEKQADAPAEPAVDTKPKTE